MSSRRVVEGLGHLIGSKGELHLEGQQVVGICPVSPGEYISFSLTQILRTAVRGMDSIHYSIVVVRRLAKGVRWTQIQFPHTELNPPFYVGLRCEWMVFLETLYFNFATLFVQATLTLQCGRLPQACSSSMVS